MKHIVILSLLTTLAASTAFAQQGPAPTEEQYIQAQQQLRSKICETMYKKHAEGAVASTVAELDQWIKAERAVVAVIPCAASIEGQVVLTHVVIGFQELEGTSYANEEEKLTKNAVVLAGKEEIAKYNEYVQSMQK